MWDMHGVVVSILGCNSGGPRFKFHPDLFSFLFFFKYKRIHMVMTVR